MTVHAQNCVGVQSQDVDLDMTKRNGNAKSQSEYKIRSNMLGYGGCRTSVVLALTNEETYNFLKLLPKCLLS